MCATTAARVLNYVNDQQDALTNLIKDLVEAESPSAHPETHDGVRRILRLALADAGYESRETGGAEKPRHIFARPVRRKRGQPSQLVLGHYDTVWPVGSPSSPSTGYSASATVTRVDSTCSPRCRTSAAESPIPSGSASLATAMAG